MENGLHIRLGHLEDARAIGVLARRVARRWILPDQSRKAGALLLSGMSARAIRDKMLQGQRFYVAFVDDVLAGVSAIRDDSHVFQLFVTTRYQGRGIGGELWQQMLRDGVRRAGTRRFTLNASRCALPVYLHLGFVPTAGETVSPRGIVATPMQLDVPEGAAVTARRRRTSR